MRDGSRPRPDLRTSWRSPPRPPGPWNVPAADARPPITTHNPQTPKAAPAGRSGVTDGPRGRPWGFRARLRPRRSSAAVNGPSAGLTSVPALRLTFSEPGWQSVSKERADAWENVARRDLTAAERMFREAELHEIRMRDARIGGEASPPIPRGRGMPKSGLADSARELGIDRHALRDSVRFAKMDQKIVEEAVQAGVDGRVKLGQLARQNLPYENLMTKRLVLFTKKCPN